MAHSKFTRTACTCPLLGRPKDISAVFLPTNKDIVLCCNFERQRLGKQSNSDKEPAFSTIAENVANKVIKIYTSASIPRVSFKGVLQMINLCHQKYFNIKKIQANGRPSDKNKIDEYVTSLDKLFDISTCKCLDMENCKCSEERKIPSNVRHFLLDQRNERKLYIPSKPCDTNAGDNYNTVSSQSS